MYWLVYFGLIIFIISLALNAIFLYRFIWKDTGSPARPIIQNILISFFSLLVTLVLLELFFAFFAQSDAFNHTLASQNWFKRYWRLNSLGYRDKEWTPELLKGRTKVMVLGDSFVAGHGIDNPEDRFSDVLGKMLGEDYAVMNVGILGAETKEEFQIALKYPYPPDVIILSFYVNDIGDTATSMGFWQPNFVSAGPPLVENSYAANFIYWRLARLGPREWSNNYWVWLSGFYEDPGVWNSYRSLLLEINNFAQLKDIKLIVVVFPNLLLIEESRPITSKVIDVYREAGVPVVDVTQMSEGLEPKDLVVNSVDWHASETVHRLIAEALYPLVLDSQENLSAQ